MRLIHEPVGGTDYKYWRACLREYSDEKLVNGLRNASGFRGYLTLGEFKALCDPPVEYRPIKSTYVALPPPKMTCEQRQERMKVLRKKLGFEKPTKRSE